MRLRIRKSTVIPSWYVIESADENDPLSDASVEGDDNEMFAIAHAIESRAAVSFKRCEVNAVGDPVYFSSPRNSREDGEVTRAEADDLAQQIRATLRVPKRPDGGSPRMTVLKEVHSGDLIMVLESPPIDSIRGTPTDMIALAEAIEKRVGIQIIPHEWTMSPNKLGVRADVEPHVFWNTATSSKTMVARADALDLARQIRTITATPAPSARPKCEVLYCTLPATETTPLCKGHGLEELANAFAAVDDARKMTRERLARPAPGEPGYVGDYAIGSEVWPGVSKLIEEMGELQQVLGKLIAIAGATVHWSGDLRTMLVEELGDVSAAVRFFATQNLTADELLAVLARSEKKLARFREWQADPKPPPKVNQDAVERGGCGRCEACTVGSPEMCVGYSPTNGGA
jgi:hypothetical protein